MVVRVYLTRHGETSWNVERRLQGWLDSQLTPRGMRDAGLLGDRLRHVNFQTVYSSSSRRAVQTAELICEENASGKRIVKMDNLKEIGLGEWEGRTHDEVKHEFPEQYEAFWNAPHRYQPASGETFPVFQRRVVSAFRQIVHETRDGNVLVVSHAVAIKAMMAHLKGLSIEELWNPPVIHGTSLTIVEMEGDVANVLVEGDLSHVTD